MASTEVSTYYDSDEDALFQSRKSKRLLMSDSDEDIATLSNTKPLFEHASSEEASSENETDPKIKGNKKKKRVVRIESESENDNEKVEDNHSSIEDSPAKKDTTNNDSHEKTVESKREVASKKKFKNILYNKLHKKKSQDVEKNRKQKLKSNHTSSEGSDCSDNENESQVFESQFTNKDLYDAESSEEDGHNVSLPSDEEATSRPDEVNDKAKEKNRKKAKQKPTQRKSSAEALEKIHAETQRLIRESNVSLPYFLPKPPTSISEFLLKRKPIPAIPLRAKGDSLNSYINLYEERMKSITETFQNISDSEEEEETNDKADKNKENKENVTNNSAESNDTIKSANGDTEMKEENFKTDTKMEMDSTINNTKMNADHIKEITNEDEANSNDGLADSKEIDNSTSDAIDKIIEDVSDKDVDRSDTSNENHSKEVANNISGDSPTDTVETTKKNINNKENGANKDELIHFSSNFSDSEISEGKSKAKCDVQCRNEGESKARDKIRETTDLSNDVETRKDNNSKNCLDISSPATSQQDKIQDLTENKTEPNASQSILCEMQNKSNLDELNSSESQSKCSESQRKSGESLMESRESQQNSECNIFSNLTDSELMNEAEYTAELCDDLNDVMLQDVSKQNGRPVKKKLFSDWSNTDQSEPSLNPGVGSETVTLNPGVGSAVTLKALSTNNNDFIELSNFTKSNLKPGVLKLMQRFSRHVSTKVTNPKPVQQTVSLNITTAERDSQGEITGYTSEALSIVLADDSDQAMSKHSAASKPGAKLVLLKEQLDKEMSRKREEAWKRRIEEAKLDEEMYEGEKSDCEADEEFEEEDDDLEDITTEEEEEEDDVREKPRKKRVKSDFLDEEAEVSEDGDNEDDESDEENEVEEGEDELGEDIPNGLEESPRSLKKKRKTFDLFATQRQEEITECDEDELPAYQMGIRSTACTPAPDKVVFSPVVTLTGCDKSLGKNEDVDFSSDVTQQRAKKLNFGSMDSELEPPSGLGNLLPTQPGNGFEDLFSGQFSSQPIKARDLEANDTPCQFVTQTQPTHNGINDLLGNACTSSLSNICSGAFSSQPLDARQLEANDGADTFLASLNAVDSHPLDDVTPKLLLNKRSILSSDEEDDADISITRKKLTKAPKQLVYSDDDEEEAEEANESEMEDNNGDDLEVEYDSEENEVVKNVDEFFEAEAELSESEWGSDDEDENEMDKMEQEEADKEHHDEELLKEELGKIHMKQVLDDDNREVKMLQEILLEDGELHSEGPRRQRQFKWSNLDDNNDLRITATLSGESEGEGEEGEGNKEDEVWRKARLDREQYLESQKDKLELADAIQEESIHHTELAKTIILNDIKTKPARPEPRSAISASDLPTKSPDSKLHALMGLHKKKGSYLSRGNQTLVRLAKITSSVPDDNNIVKKKGNFVFSAVDGPEEEETNSQPESPKPSSKVQMKRKKSLATPPLLKKLKMHDGSRVGVLSKLIQGNDF